MVIQSFSRPPDGAQDYALTPREKEVLQCLVDGLSYPQIASALCVGLGTIQNYIKAIYRKAPREHEGGSRRHRRRERAEM